MTYKEKYRQKHAKSIRRCQIIDRILEEVVNILIFISMIGVFIGLGGMDGNTTAAMILLFASLLTGIALASFSEWKWGDDGE